jgi:ATP-binding cassette subfamily B protein/subfamily B ATP-binding cassette protein MsbA
VAKSRKKLILWNGLVPSMNEVFSIVGLGVVLLLGCFILDTRNYLPIFLTYLTVAYRLTVRVRELLTSVGNTAVYCGEVGRLHEILEDKEKEFCHFHGEQYSGFSKDITFENVSLSYGTKDMYAIHNVSFAIPKNATVALVGSSGAGKSSLVDLLLRLYEPTNGKILVDGKNVRDYDVRSWREKFGVVSQDLFIFNDTIEENIRFGKLDATEGEILEAAKLSHVHDFVQRLPQGYQTVVGEKGYRLSGGERQRLSLARALVRIPEILVLDEATSHLDSQSEKIIQEALSTFRKNKSMIIVAHRLSTISQADIIIVFDKGQIVEMGSHEELIQKKGKYASFWDFQTHKSVNEAVSSLL